MGREIKRVALDFEWPFSMIWVGYVNPYRGMKCEECGGSGQSPDVKALSDSWYSMSGPRHSGWQHHLTQDEVQALIDHGRLMGFTHTPRNKEQREIVRKKVESGGNSWLPEPNGYVPTAEEVNEWSKAGFGHDAVNQWICVEARAKRMGIEELDCKWCQGCGELWPEIQYGRVLGVFRSLLPKRLREKWFPDTYEALSERWEDYDPPKGDGYQLWSTTTEGNPMSPVFETPKQLARWLATNKASSFGSDTATEEEWLRFIEGPAWAPSMIASRRGITSGVRAV